MRQKKRPPCGKRLVSQSRYFLKLVSPYAFDNDVIVVEGEEKLRCAAVRDGYRFDPQSVAQADFLQLGADAQVNALHGGVADGELGEIGEVLQKRVVGDDVLAAAVVEVQLGGFLGLGVAHETVVVEVAVAKTFGKHIVIGDGNENGVGEGIPVVETNGLGRGQQRRNQYRRQKNQSFHIFYNV